MKKTHMNRRDLLKNISFGLYAALSAFEFGSVKAVAAAKSRKRDR